MTEAFDLAVVGGGVNGCGIARDAAGRGLGVLLCEQGDIGGATSSASTKLIHGGLRYLESYDFRLVRHALAERERLWAIAPHIIWPLRFVLPHRRGLRPAWVLRAGLFLYDHLGGRKRLPGTRTLRLDRDPAGAPLRDVSRLGFEYSDAWVQDNRLVVLNARDAEARGATILPRTRVTAARREDGAWTLEIDGEGGRRTERARALVDAGGAWAGRLRGEAAPAGRRAGTRLVKGSHVVVRRLFDHDRCYIFQSPDGRIVFAIPYEEDFTLVGTTDVEFTGDPARVEASEAEVAYLCDAAGAYFRQGLSPADVVWSYAGVRALYDDGAADAQRVTRDYVLELDGEAGEAPLLTVFGGKITTYRVLAEDALSRLRTRMADWPAKGWTATKALPGGDFPVDGAGALGAELRRDHPFLDDRAARRLVRHYGTEARAILGTARQAEDLGRRWGPDLSEAEVRHLMLREYARTAEDVAWRRTKAGLRMTAADLADLDAWMAGAAEGSMRRAG